MWQISYIFLDLEWQFIIKEARDIWGKNVLISGQFKINRIVCSCFLQICFVVTSYSSSRVVNKKKVEFYLCICRIVWVWIHYSKYVEYKQLSLSLAYFVSEIWKAQICSVFGFFGKWWCAHWRLRWDNTYMGQNYCRIYSRKRT